jgi:hypothetical protein
VSVAGLAGLPALVVACVALCTPGVAHGSTHVGSEPRAAHHHTGEPHSGAATHAPASHEAQQHGDSGAATACHADDSLLSEGSSCCPTGTAGIASAVPTVRAARGAPDAPVPAGTGVPHGWRLASSVPFVMTPEVPPPSPTRSPLVLRI